MTNRYLLKEKFWSFGDNFTIRDEQENECYTVEGEIFSFGDKLTVRDMAGNEVAYISEKVFTWGHNYEIHRPGHGVVQVAKEHFTFFHCKFTADGPGDEDYEAKGDFFDQEYEFTRGGDLVARVSKRWFSWTDHYGIEIAASEDPVLLLATAVVIDLVCHETKD